MNLSFFFATALLFFHEGQSSSEISGIGSRSSQWSLCLYHLNAVLEEGTIPSPSICLIRKNQGLTTGLKLKGGDRGYVMLTMKFCRATGGGSSQHGVGDGDGLIIVDHGSRRTESNLMLIDFVSMFREKTRYPIVEPAHMELADPSIRMAFAACVQQGARRIIVSPFFLSPGRHWNQDIPSLAAEAAKEHPSVSYIVTAPLGLHPLLVDIMNDRINHCLKHVGGEVDECSVCAGTGKCRLYHNNV